MRNNASVIDWSDALFFKSIPTILGSTFETMAIKIAVFIFFVSSFFSSLTAQDRIILKNDKVYKVTITEISDTLVYFRDKDREKFSINKAWIERIDYEDISKIKFSNPKDTVFNNLNTVYFFNEPKIRKHIDSLLVFYKIPQKRMNDYYLKGESDAYLRRNYDGIYRAAFLSTFIFPPVGFIVSYSMLMAPPQINPLYITDANLLKEEAYLYGYKKMAYKQKSIRIFKGFSLGLITGSIVYYLILK